MPNINDKIEEFSKLASEDSNDLFGPDRPASLKRDPRDVLDQREFTEKYREIHLFVMEIKRLADVVDLRYRNMGKPEGLNKIIDFDYWGSIWDLKKIRKILLNRTEKLEKFRLI